MNFSNLLQIIPKEFTIVYYKIQYYYYLDPYNFLKLFLFQELSYTQQLLFQILLIN